MTLRSQLPVYSYSKHADTFRAKSLSYGRRFQTLVVKNDDPLLHVVAVHHRAPHKRLSVFTLSPSIVHARRRYRSPFLSARYAEIETLRNGNFKTQILTLNRTETVYFRTAFPLHDAKTQTECRRNGTKRSVGQKRCVNFFWLLLYVSKCTYIYIHIYGHVVVYWEDGVSCGFVVTFLYRLAV